MKKSKKLIILWTLLVTSFSCGFVSDDEKSLDARAFAQSDPVFISYVNKFEQEGVIRLGQNNFQVGDIPINFRDPDNPSHDGTCLSYSNGQKEIWIRRSWWEKTSEEQREMLLFHELGHCRLGRSHSLSVIQNGNEQLKISIMNPVIPLSSEYKSHKEAYLTELFTQEINLFSESIGGIGQR